MLLVEAKPWVLDKGRLQRFLQGSKGNVEKAFRHLREFVANYRHPAPRRGGTLGRFCPALPRIPVDSGGSAGSAGEFPEATNPL